MVAESRRNDLEPFMELRHPASDIPPQSRRLYVVNTLRLTADLRSTPVPLRADGTETQTLDMRHCVLRSVSPVCIDDLTTMGVRASMSMSIVIDGRLRGLLACHHAPAN